MAVMNRGLGRSQWLIAGIVLIGLVILLGYSRSDSIVIRGIPLKIILTAASDPSTITAYLRGDKVALHQRLQDKGVEAAIKAHYRPQIPNEEHLDQYIHQLFYDVSGYVGVAYRVNDQGILELRQRPSDPRQKRWLNLALKLGVISQVTDKNGIKYVTGLDGTEITYAQASRLFPLAMLEQLNQASPPVSGVKP